MWMPIDRRMRSPVVFGPEPCQISPAWKTQEPAGTSIITGAGASTPAARAAAFICPR